jgi:hypothetical protein
MIKFVPLFVGSTPDFFNNYDHERSVDQLHPNLTVALWAALVAAVASLLINLLVAVILPRLRRRNLTRKIRITRDQPHDGNARFSVKNGGFWTVADAMLYLYLEIHEQDVLHQQGIQTHIAPGRFVPFRDSGEQLCWSVTPNPMKVDILAKENQPFSPCHIDHNYILIPSESGWGGPVPHGFPPSVARVILARRVYVGRLTLVSADTDARRFNVRIDPESIAAPCVITPE